MEHLRYINGNQTFSVFSNKNIYKMVMWCLILFARNLNKHVTIYFILKQFSVCMVFRFVSSAEICLPASRTHCICLPTQQFTSCDIADVGVLLMLLHIQHKRIQTNKASCGYLLCQAKWNIISKLWNVHKLL